MGAAVGWQVLASHQWLVRDLPADLPCASALADISLSLVLIVGNIPCVLFVTGAAASVTPAGLATPSQFFRVLFPAMLCVLIVFRTGVAVSKESLSRGFGVVLLVVYILTTLVS